MIKKKILRSKSYYFSFITKYKLLITMEEDEFMKLWKKGKYKF